MAKQTDKGPGVTFSTFSELSGYTLSFLRVELAILRNLNTTIVSHDRTWWLVLSDETLIRSERNMTSKNSCELQESISTPRTDRVHSHVLVCFSAEVYTSDRLSNFQQNTHLLQQVRPSRDSKTGLIWVPLRSEGAKTGASSAAAAPDARWTKDISEARSELNMSPRDGVGGEVI